MSLEPATPILPDGREHIFVLGLGDTRIALRLFVVERVIRAVASTPGADAPERVSAQPANRRATPAQIGKPKGNMNHGQTNDETT